MPNRRIQHVAELAFVLRRHDHHPLDAAQVREVENPTMGGSVGSHKAGPVETEHNMQMLQRDIVNNLVIRPLEER